MNKVLVHSITLWENVDSLVETSIIYRNTADNVLFKIETLNGQYASYFCYGSGESQGINGLHYTVYKELYLERTHEGITIYSLSKQKVLEIKKETCFYLNPLDW